MKTSVFLCCFLLFCTLHHTAAQGVASSTVKQVFSLQKGDSLEYHTQTLEMMPGCGEICNTYRLNVVDSVYYNASHDTLYVSFSSQIIHKDTLLTLPNYGCDVCHSNFMIDDYFLLGSGLWVVTDLDSTIKYLMDTIYGTAQGGSYDSTDITGNMYNGSKETKYDYSYHMMSDFREVYVDSIGIVYKTEENQTATNNTEWLIYYHKANGKQWGTPYMYTSIKDIPSNYHATVIPNPAEDKFVLKTDLYMGIHFRLFDELSKPVISLDITKTETEINRGQLSSGIYFWQISNGINIIKTGTLMLK